MKDKILKLIFKVVVAVSVVGIFVASIIGAIGIHKLYEQDRYIIRSTREVTSIDVLGTNRIHNRVDYYEIDTRTGIVTIYQKNGAIISYHIDNLVIYELDKTEDLEG